MNEEEEEQPEEVVAVLRCPVCRSQMPLSTDPRDVCSRCLVVRGLEVERMSQHRRLEP